MTDVTPSNIEGDGVFCVKGGGLHHLTRIAFWGAAVKNYTTGWVVVLGVLGVAAEVVLGGV